MIRIVEEEEMRSLTEKSAGPPKRPDIHSQLAKLKDILAAKEAEIERLRTGGGIDAAKAGAQQEVITKQIRERDEEIARLKDRHVRDVEIIANLHDNIDELKIQVEGLKAEALELRRGTPQPPQPVQPAPTQQPRPPAPQQQVAPQPPQQAVQQPQPAVVSPQPQQQGHSPTFMESQPGNEPPREDRPAEEYQAGGPVVHPPGADQNVIQAEQVPFEEQAQEAVVIPLDGNEKTDGTPTVKYRPLD